MLIPPVPPNERSRQAGSRDLLSVCGLDSPSRLTTSFQNPACTELLSIHSLPWHIPQMSATACTELLSIHSLPWPISDRSATGYLESRFRIAAVMSYVPRPT